MKAFFFFKNPIICRRLQRLGSNLLSLWGSHTRRDSNFDLTKIGLHQDYCSAKRKQKMTDVVTHKILLFRTVARKFKESSLNLRVSLRLNCVQRQFLNEQRKPEGFELCVCEKFVWWSKKVFQFSRTKAEQGVSPLVSERKHHTLL